MKGRINNKLGEIQINPEVLPETINMLITGTIHVRNGV